MASAITDELHMKTTEPQTTADSTEEPAPKATEPPQDAQDPEGASPAKGVKEDTAAPATMSGIDSEEAEEAHKPEIQQRAEETVPKATEEEPEEDVVATLHSLFPSIDRETIEELYRAEGQDADRTAQLLLQLSGQGDASEIDSTLHSHSQQISADEAFARQLQEEESAHQQTQSQQGQYSNLSYQPRVTPRTGGAAPRQQHQQQQHHYGHTPHDGEGGVGRDEFDQALDHMKAGVATATEYGRGLFNKLSTRIQQMQMGDATQQPHHGQQQGHTSSASARHGFLGSGHHQSSAPPPELPQRSNSSSGRMAPALPHADRYRQSSQKKQDSVSSADAPVISSESAAPQQTHTPSQLNDATAYKEDEAKVPSLDKQGGDDDDVEGQHRGPAPQRIAVRNDDSDSDEEEYVRNPFDDRD